MIQEFLIHRLGYDLSVGLLVVALLGLLLILLNKLID